MTVVTATFLRPIRKMSRHLLFLFLQSVRQRIELVFEMLRTLNVQTPIPDFRFKTPKLTLY